MAEMSWCVSWVPATPAAAFQAEIFRTAAVNNPDVATNGMGREGGDERPVIRDRVLEISAHHLSGAGPGIGPCQSSVDPVDWIVASTVLEAAEHVQLAQSVEVKGM